VRSVGDLQLAEDAVQEACLLAVRQWPADGVPANPSAWLVGVARHKAIDALRREARRPHKEHEAMLDAPRTPAGGDEHIGDDRLALIFACCHPALDGAVRVPLTMRAVCGLSTAQIAATFLVAEPAMAQRLVRAKRKIRQAAIPFRVPPPELLGERLADVLRVVYLLFTAGHRAPAGPELVLGELCEEAIRLARVLAELLPDEPEVAGLLALLLLTDARRPARVDDGELVLLDEQDRGRWDTGRIREGEALLERTLAARRPGPYQLQAAIAACHARAPSAAATDWRQIVALYDELLRLEPSPVVAANRAAAVAMADGPAAGLAALDALTADPRLARWAPLALARADLLRRAGRGAEALAAYAAARSLAAPDAELGLIERRIAELAGPTNCAG
jgi:RNA polymerase sigma-70 factor (ECF subfamily)